MKDGNIMPAQQFVNWMAIQCPRLNVHHAREVTWQMMMGTRLDLEEIVAYYDEIQANGLLWCVNWELIQAGRPGLN